MLPIKRRFPKKLPTNKPPLNIAAKKRKAPVPSRPATQAEWLQSIAVIAPVGIYRTDANGRCIWVNKYWMEMTGHSFEDAKGFGWKDLIHPADRERVASEWAAAFQGTKPFKLEYRHLRPDGSFLWIYGCVAKAQDADDEVGGYIGASTDITALHAPRSGSGDGITGKGASPALTAREQEVVQHIAGGDSNKCVADRLGLSVRTVESHRARIMRKLRVTSLPELVRYAVRKGLVEA